MKWLKTEATSQKSCKKTCQRSHQSQAGCCIVIGVELQLASYRTPGGGAAADGQHAADIMPEEDVLGEVRNNAKPTIVQVVHSAGSFAAQGLD